VSSVPLNAVVATPRASNTNRLGRARYGLRWVRANLLDWLATHWHGYVDVWRANSLSAMLHLASYNLFGIRRRVRLKISGHEITLRTGTPDFTVAVESLGREFEAVTMGFACEHGALIIDGGGYIGTSAIKLATAYPNCRIVCIEPSSENIELLRANIAAFPNVSVIKAALAATESEVKLRDPGRQQWGFTILAEADARDRVLETVPAVTVDKLLADHGSERVFILKLDIEGAEAELLQNSKDWMHRTDILIAELHEWIMEGSEAAYHSATKGRVNSLLPGEKVMSLHPELTVSRR
jgi:FkbM family methyltransferase